MVLTRPQAKLAFKHVVVNVLGHDEQSHLYASLIHQGIEDIFSLTCVDQEFVDSLTYQDPNNSTNRLPILKAQKYLIREFLRYVVFRNIQDDPIGDNWNAITPEDFDRFRLDPSHLNAMIGVPANRNTSTPTYSAPPGFTPADMFRRGIKRDPSLFPTLKDEKFNDSWHRSFQNQARAQNVSEVLDPSFNPSTPEEQELFMEKQKYLYAVLESKVLTDKGKTIVREHEDTFDAQAVYQKLTEHHLRSTKAMIESSTILSYITSVRLGNGEWQGSTEAFVLHWQNQVRLYERQVPPSDHFSDGQKRTMLENAVAVIDELRQVKNNADLEKTKSGRTLTYDEYSNLLLSAAITYDEQYKPKKTKRQVLQHFISALDDDSGEEYDSFGIDADIQLLQANASKLSRPMSKSAQKRFFLPKQSWQSLSEKDKQIWDQLDDKAKSIIMGSSQVSSQTKHNGTDARKQHVNLHEISAYDYIQANLHDMHLTPSNEDEDEVFEEAIQDVANEDQNDAETLLINAAKSTGSSKLPPGDIRRVMSKSSKRSVNVTNVVYKVSSHQASTSSSLVDRGANGGVAGTDVRVIFKTHRAVDIRGIDNHQVTDIGIGTVGGVVTSQKGPVIAVMHQYALLNKGHSIHSPCQFEWYKNDVNDKSIHVGGLQRIQTLDGYIIPLHFKDGLARLDIRPYTDDEWDSLPHVFLTGETEWDPTVLDFDHGDIEDWADALTDLNSDPTTNLFDEFGNYRHRVLVNQLDCQPVDLDELIDACVDQHHEDPPFYDCFQQIIDNHEEDNNIDIPSNLEAPKIVSKKAPDYNLLRPLFGWLSSDIVQKTFENTTQYARLPSGTLLKRSFKSPNPALNVTRRNEAVACDIVYSDVPAIDDGSVAAVLFTGTDTQVTDVYGIKTDKQFINTLEDNIRQRGAPNKLISDRAQVEISKKVLDILRTLCIGDWQSEPHQQQQNPAERKYQTVKTAANRIMDRSGAAPNTWLLCLKYVCYLLNHTYNSTINSVPLQLLTGTTVDISALLRFHFWQKVYFKQVDSGFPSQSTEAVGHIVGISEHCGHALTWKVLHLKTNKVLFRSLVRPFTEDDPNLRADLCGGEDDGDPIIKSSLFDDKSKQVTSKDGETLYPAMPTFNPEDLIGKTFLMDALPDGQCHRARVARLVQEHEDLTLQDPTRLKFVLSVNNDQAEEVITYNQLLDYMSKDEEDGTVWRFKHIVSHQGPLKPDHIDYKGSMYNLMVKWENGEVTTEPLKVIAADDPVICAIYARDNNLLELPGWKRFKGLAKRQKKFQRLVNQAKLRSYNTSPRYKYGYEIPRSYKQALELDKKNQNTLWQDAISLERKQIVDYGTFIDHGHHSKSHAPSGYQRIRVHFVFDVKHDGRHKARLVADGHLTDVPVDSVYSGVVSLRGFRLVCFLAELNALQLWATDIGNAYLEAMTSEKVYIIAGPEFGDLEGHILVIYKALYGLRSSGARWHDKFADCLRELGFHPCKAEPDIWMRKVGQLYEYIAVYVDDLAMAMIDPQEFVSILESRYNFKLKGTGAISFHLGMDLHRDKDGILCITPIKYIEKMIKSYERIFGELPKQNVTSPLEKGDHPELDTSELLDSKGIVLYQSLIGALQWAVSIGRFDVATAVMTLSSFRAAPRRGHLDRAKRIYGYLSKMRHGSLRIRTEEPDFSDLPNLEYDWSQTVYGNLSEMLPHDAPDPLGQFVTLSHYVDANLMHDVISGKSVTGILHMLNKTPIDWYSKKQATVETATYGSEFVAARICVEQVIDLRNTLRYLGVPLRAKSYMFGDNKSVVDSSMQVNAKLHKRHVILSFHRVRESIASGMIGFFHIAGESNPADILSKHWGYSQIWSQLKALLFWQGDTIDVPA